MSLGQPKQDANGGGAGSTHGGAAGGALALSTGVNELGQLALWMAASLAGMVTAVLAARTPFFRSVMRRMGLSTAESRGNARAKKLGRPTREQSLPMLAEAIVGSSKSAIASVFGPPRSAVVMNTPAPASGQPNYWQADTWYYPMPKNGPLAMAIEFTGEDARHVEFLRAPEV
jgi:hypothetical protein